MPQRNTKIILISLLLVDFILLSFFIGLYWFILDRSNDTSLKKEKIISEIKKQESRSIMQNDLLLTKTYDEKIKKLFIENDNIVGFIKTLEDIVLSSGLKSDVKSVTSEPDSDLDSINSEYVRVKLDVTGEWKNIYFFIELLENYPLVIKIDKIFVTKFSDNDSSNKKIPQWLGSFEFTVLKIKDNK